jgi:hypothetical protein
LHLLRQKQAAEHNIYSVSTLSIKGC